MTTINKQLIITAELNDFRLDQALAVLCQDFSRSQWQQWIRHGDVQIDTNVVNQPRYKVREGQIITTHTEPLARENWSAQALPLDIVYADEDLIIINKPAGLVVHPGAGNPDQTLINALLHYDVQLAQIPRAGLVHRLDKETSGLLLIARNLSSYHHLVQALQQREIQRIYQAVVHGVPISGGTVDAAIGRDQKQRTKMSVKARGGKPAITHYRIIQRFRQHTHIQVQLETGRTHQIRVHMAHIKHPVVGDPVYGKKTHSAAKLSPELITTLQAFERQALHASCLSLQHPRTGTVMSWESPLPMDIKLLLDTLAQDM